MIEPQRMYFWGNQIKGEKQEDQNYDG